MILILLLILLAPPVRFPEGTATRSLERNPSLVAQQEPLFPDAEFLLPKVVHWGGENNISTAWDLSFDSKQNIIVGGVTHDFWGRGLLLKYSPTGELLWELLYQPNDSSLGEQAWISCVAIDSEDNIFCVGEVSTGMFLMKVTADSDILWVRPFGAPYSYPWEILLSPDGCPVVVARSGIGTALLAKFSPTDGTLLWNLSYNPTPFYEEGYALTIDEKGSIYLSSSTYISLEQMTMTICKVSATGDILWEQTFAWYDLIKGYGLIMDSTGNYLYFAGKAFLTGEGRTWDVLVGKLEATTGKVVWRTTWGAGLFDEGFDIHLTPDGSLLVTGRTEHYGKAWECFICKFSATTGELLWEYTWGKEKNDECYASALQTQEAGGATFCLVGRSSSFNVSGVALLLIFSDSDGDGLTDAWEEQHGTNALSKDSDSDGLSDYEELACYFTDPLNSDSDGDGWSDGKEVAWGTDPLRAQSTPYRRKMFIAITVPLTLLLIYGAIVAATVKRLKDRTRLT